MRNLKKQWKRFNRKYELILMISVLILAGVFTFYKPIEASTLSYFSDFTTPAVILVAITMIVFSIKKKEYL